MGFKMNNAKQFIRSTGCNMTQCNDTIAKHQFVVILSSASAFEKVVSNPESSACRADTLSPKVSRSHEFKSQFSSKYLFG